MGDPVTLSLAGVGVVVVTEGIKFLYRQAGEILKRWRVRRDKIKSSAPESSLAPAQTESANVILPPIFEGQLSSPLIHFDAVQDAEAELQGLYSDLSVYANGIEPIEDTDEELLAKVNTLRQILENVYQQRITFKGENRPASGTALVGKVKAKSVVGEAIGVDAEGKLPGEARGEVVAERIEQGGKATGVKWRPQSKS
jgi:hypothetical protein